MLSTFELSVVFKDDNLKGLQKKIDENLGQLCEYENQNKRFTSENANLFTRLEF